MSHNIFLLFQWDASWRLGPYCPFTGDIHPPRSVSASISPLPLCCKIHTRWWLFIQHMKNAALWERGHIFVCFWTALAQCSSGYCQFFQPLQPLKLTVILRLSVMGLMSTSRDWLGDHMNGYTAVESSTVSEKPISGKCVQTGNFYQIFQPVRRTSSLELNLLQICKNWWFETVMFSGTAQQLVIIVAWFSAWASFISQVLSKQLTELLAAWMSPSDNIGAFVCTAGQPKIS